jgi:hypothetical protein
MLHSYSTKEILYSSQYIKNFQAYFLWNSVLSIYNLHIHLNIEIYNVFLCSPYAAILWHTYALKCILMLPDNPCTLPLYIRNVQKKAVLRA